MSTALPSDQALPPGDDEMKSDQTVPFVVGKLGKDDRRLVVLDDTTPAPIQGPFELRAVFSK